MTIMRVWLLALSLLADPRALFESGMAAHRAGRLEEAQRLLEQARREAPRNLAILANLGAVRAQRGQHAAALEAYEEALKLDPRSARLRLNMALAWFRQGDAANALGHLDAFLAAEPADSQGRELRALCLYQTGRFAESAEEYRLLLDREPKLSWLYGHGQALLRAGKEEEGRAAIQRMFDLYPAAPETQLLEAQMKIAERKYPEAIAQLDQLAARKPPLPAAQLWLGVAYESARRFPEAKAAYLREANASGDMAAFYALGIAEARDGRDAEAAKWLERARGIDSASNNVSFHLARAYLKLGQPARAIPLLDKAIERDPKSTPPRYARVQALQALNRHADARAESGRIRDLLRQP